MQAKHSNKRFVSGIKPTGRPHLGNYLGVIEPALKLATLHHAFFFIADYHALTTLRDPVRLNRLVTEVAAAWLALGLNPESVVFYRQSAIPEIFELMWIFCCATPKGLLNRGHAYKSAVQHNLNAGREADENVNAGVFNYPMLMAADILALAAELVLVGRDQKQHVEIARDAAGNVNRIFGRVFTLPEAWIDEKNRTVPGLDGRKMSNSYGNEIPVLASPEVLRQRVMRIVTDSLRPEDPKDPERCNLFNIYRQVAPQNDVAGVRALYEHGGLAYKTLKEELIAVLVQRFAAARERLAHLMRQPEEVDAILAHGASEALPVARDTLERVREAVGIGRRH